MSNAYEVRGRDIYKLPVETKNDDGSTSITMGFHVCKVSQYIDPEIVKNIFEKNEGQP